MNATRSTLAARARVGVLATVLAVTSFAVTATPGTAPVGDDPFAGLLGGIGELTAPQQALAAWCASNPNFAGYLTASSSSTTPASRITNPTVYGYISNVNAAWSCTNAFRYSGLAWNITDNAGRWNWGNLINSTSVACNFVVGSTDYAKANGTTDCPDTDAEYAMSVILSAERVYTDDWHHDSVGDISFAQSDCGTYYGSSVASGSETTPRSFDATNVYNRPGSNCDPYTNDGFSSSPVQTVTYDATVPTLNFDTPDELASLATVTGAAYTVQFDATDGLAGFGGASGWTLTRQIAPWDGTTCGTFTPDSGDGAVTTGTTSALDQTVAQTLASGSCYRWTLTATDQNGNAATPVTSGVVRRDVSTLLGMPGYGQFESFGLGAGDSLAVNIATGNVLVSHPVVSLPIRGSSVSIGVTYNSQDLTNVGMGPGWRLSVQRRLVLNADSTVTFIDGDGSRHTFTNPVVNGTVTTYTRPSTLYATLVKDTSLSANEFILTSRDQGRDKFDIAGSEGILVRAEDRFANGVTLAYASGTNRITTITDTAGSRTITFAYDASNRVSSITDWANVSAGIVQASGAGNRVNRFFYDAGGTLAGWADPLNTTGSCPTAGSHLTCLTYANGLLSGIGRTHTYETLVSGALGTATYAPTPTTSIAYRGGDIASVTDAAGAATVFSRPAAGVTLVARPGTPASQTKYGLVSPADSLARVQSIWRKFGAAWIEQRTAYDASYPTEPATVTDNYGASPARTVSYTYVASTLGLVSRQTEPLDGTNNRTTDYTWNANNDVTSRTVALNAGATRTITRSCYHATTCNTTDADPKLYRVNRFFYDAGGTNGNVEDVTTTFEVDAYGQRTRETRANYATGGTLLDQAATGWTYDAYGNVTAEIRNYANGTVTSPGDDITPNATTNARTDLTTAFGYDTAGNRVSVADPRRAIYAVTPGSPGPDDYLTTWTYSALNERLTEKTPTTPGVSGTQRTSSSTYDELGNIRAATDFGGLVTATEVDRAGRATRTYEDPDGAGGTAAVQTSAASYDASGRVLTTKDQRQVNNASLGYSQSAYDELGRLIAQAWAVTTADATETDYAYDGLDRQTAVITGVSDTTSQRTSTTYDLSGRATAVDDEFTCTSSTFDYRDLALTRIEGQTSGSCTGSGLRTVTNTFDGLGRLKTSTVTAGAGVNDRPIDQVFDAVGNVLTSSSYVAATGLTITITSTVNALDQVIAEIRSTGTWAKTNFDAAGSPTDRCLWSAASSDPCMPAGSTFANPQPTSVTTATFDARGNRIALVDAVANSSTTYDPDHNYQPAAFYLPTGGTKEHQTTFGYDERHRLTSVTHKLCAVAEHPCSSGNTLQTTGSDTYAYDVSDNRTQVNETNGSATVNRYYCYDAVDRLISTRSSTGCSSGLLDAYTYDDSGNRKTTSTVTFTYSTSGQLASCTSGCGTVAHDAVGRTQKLNGWFYEYDAEGRMIRACQSTSCTGSVTKLEFAYDGQGHRTQIKEYTTGTLAKTWDFRYQGDAIVEEKLTDAAHPSGAVVRNYVVDDTGSIVKMTIPSGEPRAGSYLVTWSGHGDALALWQINPSSGVLTLANSYTYTTWGQPSTATHNGIPDLGFRFLYVGEFDVQWDNAASLGLLYMHARHYSPALGRFLQPDPDASEANLYAYAANSPVTTADPDGTCFILCAIVNAAIDTAIYLATTDQSEWSLGGVATAAATGAVTGFLGVGLLSKVAKVGVVAKALTKVPKAGRGLQGSIRWNNGWRTPGGQFAKAPMSGGPRAGQRAEEAVWDAIDAKPGWSAIRGGVTVTRGGQTRVYDGAALSPRGRVIGLETKSGGARRTAAQRLFDLATSRSSPAIGVGRHLGLRITRTLLISGR